MPARETYVWNGKRMVLKHPRRRSSGVHSVISDTMAPTTHMADGKTYESKSAFRRRTKAAGCIEVGNEPLVPKTVEFSRRDRVDAIKQAFAMHEQGYRPPQLPQMKWE